MFLLFERRNSYRLGIPDLPENRLVLRIILEALIVQKKIIGSLVETPDRKIEYFAAPNT